MNSDAVDKLMELGLAEYEAKAYLSLLRESPITGHELAELSGVPRSTIYEVVGRLTARGAAVTLPTVDANKYAPVPVGEFLDRLHREYGELIVSLKDNLSALTSCRDLEYLWTIEGQDNIMDRAREMISRTQSRIYLALLPTAFPALRSGLEEAIGQGVQVVVYTTSCLQLPGGRVVVTPMSQKALNQMERLSLILIVDGQEALIGEWLTATQARACWTRSPLFVSVFENHLLKGGRRRFLISRNVCQGVGHGGNGSPARNGAEYNTFRKEEKWT